MAQKSLYIVLMVMYLSVHDLYAQSQKIGYIDSDVIMQRIPEYSGIEQRLSLLSDGWRQEIQRMENEISDLEQDFEAREILFTDDIREQRLSEIDRRKEQLNNFIEEKYGPNGEYFTVQKELLEPIQRTIFDALSRVASREAFDFVFDRSDDIRFLYARQEWNLTDEVMLELGIDEPSN